MMATLPGQLEQPTWLSTELVSVKINGVREPALGEYTSERLVSHLPTLLQIAYGIVL